MPYIKFLFPKEEKRDVGLVSLFHFLHDFCGKIFLLLCSDPAAYLEERRGEVSPALYSKIGKKCLNFGKKCPDCCHLWVKFLIQNAIFKSFQAKNRIFFLCGALPFRLVGKLLSKCPCSKKNSSTLKTSWLRTCDQILLSGCIYFVRYWGIYVV